MHACAFGTPIPSRLSHSTAIALAAGLLSLAPYAGATDQHLASRPPAGICDRGPAVFSLAASVMFMARPNRLVATTSGTADRVSPPGLDDVPADPHAAIQRQIKEEHQDALALALALGLLTYLHLKLAPSQRPAPPDAQRRHPREVAELTVVVTLAIALLTIIFRGCG